MRGRPGLDDLIGTIRVGRREVDFLVGNEEPLLRQCPVEPGRKEMS